MGNHDNKLSELVDLVKSWIPHRVEPVKLSRDFWMPDRSCWVCYECDSQFNVFNHKHHCRLCGRVFCARCTSNSIPAEADDQKAGRDDRERIRVCNYCLKQWEQGIVSADHGSSDPMAKLSPCPSTTSLISSKSSCTCNSGSGSTIGSIPYSTGPFQHVAYCKRLSPHGPIAQMDSVTFDQDNGTSERGPPCGDTRDQPSNQYSFCINRTRSDDEDDDYGLYHSDLESRHCGSPIHDDMEHFYGPFQVHHEDRTDSNNVTSGPLHDSNDMHRTSITEEWVEKVDVEYGFGGAYLEQDSEGMDSEPVDFENNWLLWLPPDLEDEDDEREAALFDDDDGEWSYLHSANGFGRGEFRNRKSQTRSTGQP